jgi:hypothetical protein
MRLIELNKSNYKNKVLSGIALTLVIYTMVTYVISLSAFTSPSQDLRWNSIPYVNYATYNPGDTITVEGELIEGDNYFSRGKYYYFSSSEDIIWIVNVIDPDNKPIYFTTGEILNAQSDQVLGDVEFSLPSNAVPGTYVIKLLVWSDWLPAGETRMNVLGEISFEVVLP